MAPAIPPMPTIEATARLGNMSEESVKRFAEKPWCAAAARPMMRTADHRPSTLVAKTIGGTHNAQTSMATLRLTLTVEPRSINEDDIQPPATLPNAAIR